MKCLSAAVSCCVLGALKACSAGFLTSKRVRCSSLRIVVIPIVSPKGVGQAQLRSLQTPGAMALVTGLSVGVALLLLAFELGLLPVPLPFPPGLDAPYMHTPPAGVLPPKYSTINRFDNEALRSVQFLFEDKVVGVETVAVDENGRLAFADKFGKLFLAHPKDGGYQITEEPIAYLLPGRTLGAMFDSAGDLYLCNTPLGLVKVTQPGGAEQKVILVTARTTKDSPMHPDQPADFMNGIDITSDGTLYLSHTSDVPSYRNADGSYDVTDNLFVTLAKGSPKGMLLAYHPSNGSTLAFLDKLWWGNGLALAHDDSFVLIGDSWVAKIYKYWLKGAKAGTSEVFVDNLPGIVDGLSRSKDGNYWLAVPAGFPEPVAFSNFRLVRLAIAYAPRIMRALGVPIPPIGLVMKLSPEGKVLQLLADPGGKHIHLVSSAVEHDGKLFLGSLSMRGIGVLDLKNV